ncbi:riboflavin kinase [Blastomyces dermatitidis ATCC 18188]|uniref:Riboflavin kinase n=1 Tax=Ajellomyces dermatitidis (strain ATCC 18188 / CBS 674.68) TaxID=653446 RepID=F2T455_AJEDA|nr:riboflavin kinase [Blastomyces dermatitidis ATCC 18188]
MRPAGPRDPVAGPDSGPPAPYPMKLSGPVIKGFGRGSKELGIPTANIPPDSLSPYGDVESGVYYGVAALDPSKFKYKAGSDENIQPNGAAVTQATESNSENENQNQNIFPCVLSIGYNPFYKNTVRSVEIHLLPQFTHRTTPSSPSPNSTDQPNRFFRIPDFYGTRLNLLVLGYIRPEYDYVSLEALVEDIRIDCEVAKRSLERPGYLCYVEGDAVGGEGDSDGGGVAKGVREARGWLREF